MNNFPSDSDIGSLEAFVGLVDGTDGKSWQLLQRVHDFENNFKAIERDARVPKEDVIDWEYVSIPVIIPDNEGKEC